MFSTVGDIMSTVRGYHEYRAGYHEYRGVFSTVGDIMSIVEGVQCRGGYHPLKFEYRGGCSVLWGTQITKDYPPTILNTLHGTHESPMCIMISPRYSRYPPHLS